MKPGCGWISGSRILLAVGTLVLLVPLDAPAQTGGDLRGIGATLALGPGKTLEDARKVFEKEAMRGYAPAEVNLAVFYINGLGGVSQNYGKALYWLKLAAGQGLPIAYTNLGILYMNGSGVRQDYAEALHDFRYAAEHGESAAMVDLGYMTESGQGASPNEAAAVEWYRRAADRGYALGENNLADCYLRGLGVPQSDALAAWWFQKAAEQGQPAARIKLGYLRMVGRGVPRDPTAAYMWILAARLAGDHRGDEYLLALQAELKPEQIARATERARELEEVRPAAAVEIASVP